MSYDDFFENIFRKKKRLYKSSYCLNVNRVKSINRKRKFLEETLYITPDIINIINSYIFHKYQYKLLQITKDNIKNITKIDDDITAIICINLDLTKLPEYIYDASNVISLNCSFNNITKIEQGLSRLKMLNASFNNLTELPGDMEDLEELYVIYNRLEKLPDMPKLKTVSCIHNKIKYIDSSLYPDMDRCYSYWNSETLDEISRKINQVQPIRKSKRRKKGFVN